MTSRELVIKTEDGEQYIGDIKSVEISKDVEYNRVLSEEISVRVGELFKQK